MPSQCWCGVRILDNGIDLQPSDCISIRLSFVGHPISDVSFWVELQQIIKHLSGGSTLTASLVPVTRINRHVTVTEINHMYFFM